MKTLDRLGGLLLLSGLILSFPARPCLAAGDFPLASTGDIWFQMDHAGFLGEKNEVVEEYYFRITNNQLKFEEEDEIWESRVFVRVVFKDIDGKEVAEASRRFEFTVENAEIAASPDYAQLLVIREPLDPRTHFVEAEVEDINARKQGLLYMVTGKRKNGKAEGTLRKPETLEREFAISDIQFAWEVQEAGEGAAFEKNGLNVIPNPSRTYGLLLSRMSAYYEVYDLRELGDSTRTYIVHHELQGPGGNLIRSKPDTVESASGEWVKVISFDLSKVVTGEHVFRAVVLHPQTGSEVITERTFSLLWRSEFWDMTEQDVLDEARVLFTEEEYERFKGMSAGDRAQYIEKFWADADPSPGAARNELRNEFLRRVGYANRQFSEHGTKGMLTDRGRIYIRFGEPDEITQELMPTQDTQLDQRVRGLEEENPQGRLLATSDVVDTRPYEIWTYTRQGTPLFPERELATSVTGLRFVFIDETGTGHYVLRYQSDFIGY